MILLLVHDPHKLDLAIIGHVEDRMPTRRDPAQAGTRQFISVYAKPLDIQLRFSDEA